MTPAEHYAQAENLLYTAVVLSEDEPALPLLLAEAQVHATLALARGVDGE